MNIQLDDIRILYMFKLWKGGKKLETLDKYEELKRRYKINILEELPKDKYPEFMKKLETL